MKKIAISGSQCTGKTTLVNYLKTLPEFEKYDFYTSMTRDINDHGLPINQEGGWRTQLLILARHVDRILTPHPNGVVCDRSIIDGLVYTMYLQHNHGLPVKIGDMAISIYSTIIEEYDRIFYLPCEIDIEDDGQRSIDVEFRNGVDELFQYYNRITTKNFNCKVQTITGTVEQRAQVILDYIKE